MDEDLHHIRHVDGAARIVDPIFDGLNGGKHV
jgi:hypothetical protein